MLKPINKDQSINVISVQDPAIDFDRSERRVVRDVEVLAYAIERHRDPSSWRRSVKFRDGETPTIFEVGIIPSAERARIEDDCKSNTEIERHKELSWRCFLHGVRNIHGGFETDDAPRVTIDGVEYLSPSWLRIVFVGPLMMVGVEVGGTIWAWNQLGDDDAKK